MKRLLLTLVALALTLALASLAFAGQRQVVKDAQGDSTSDVDIARAKAEFDGKHLVFTVKVYGKVAGNNPCVELKKDNLVGCFGNEITSPDPSSELSGVHVTVDNHKRKNVFTVSWKKIGSPKAVDWRGVFLEEDQAADAAPDHGYSNFKLAG